MPSQVCELVLIADDFGLSNSVSVAILDLLNSGIVSGTSAMMCEPLTEELLLSNKLTLSGRVGVHLQATKASSLLPHKNVVSLTNHEGLFYEKWNPRQYEISEVEAEWQAQIDKFLNLGLGITHIDSHHNIHLSDKPLIKLTEVLGQRNGARVRRAANQLFTKRLNENDCDMCLNSWTLTKRPASDLVREIEQLTSTRPSINRIEIITHPGFVDERLMSVSSSTYSREYEFEQLIKLPNLLDKKKYVIKK